MPLFSGLPELKVYMHVHTRVHIRNHSSRHIHHFNTKRRNVLSGGNHRTMASSVCESSSTDSVPLQWLHRLVEFKSRVRPVLPFFTVIYDRAVTGMPDKMKH